MGQRHQIYVKLPATNYGKGNCNNRPSRVIGLHHQWLFGQTALISLARVMSFLGAKENAKYCSLRGRGSYEAIEILSALYSIDAATGYYHRVHDISTEDSCQDPRLGDNNDGITIIDLSKDTVKYCFMRLDGLGRGDAADGIPNLKPLSAKKYLAAYYPDFETNSDPENLEFNAKNRELVAGFENQKLLTLSEVKKIFPKMFVEEK